MSWALFGIAALLCLSPFLFTLWRPALPRGRREADLALYQAQRAELDGQLAEGRLDQGSHATAVLELQRRILAAPAEAVLRQGAGQPVLWAALFLIPALGLGLYLWHGQPGLPSATLAERTESNAREEALLGQLRARVESLDPANPATRQGWLLLGNAERSRGHLPEAAQAWQKALAARFDPDLAGDTAELLAELDRPAEATALLQRALAERPADVRLRYLLGAIAIRQGEVAQGKAVWQALLDSAPPDAPWRAPLAEQLRRLP
ncbi:c-type cytochrome biogenesis protein CcmI [Roseomonas gilardii]|uniref:c-type cytochrome biogenesis protein CcmI n=1 Tax=Roseomonas gilardii TaxID=257708 RepID=UPI0011A7FA39|nr:c-type cytochrome biogenesis protein CcmI [Roseomonas gilardii]